MPADLSFLRSRNVIIGGIVVAVALTACACGAMGDDDDDCFFMGDGSETVFAAGSSGLRLAAAPAESETQAIPAVGGFGTKLGRCGG